MKRLFLPSLVLAVLFLSLGCVGNTPDATLLKGLEAYRDGDWWGAIHYFKMYVEKWPDHNMHNEALFYLGDCNFNADQLQPAEDYFRRFLSAAPSHQLSHRARLSLAMILDRNSRSLEKEGKSEEAAAAWRESEELLKDVSSLNDPIFGVLADQATVYLANASFVHGATAEAILLYERRLAKAERGLARAELDAATPSRLAAAIADPTDARMWLDSLQQLATIHSVEKDWDKARRYHEEIIAATFLAPDMRVNEYRAVAATYRAEDRLADAIAVYQRMRDELVAEDVDMATVLTILSSRFVADAYIAAGSPLEASAVLDPVYDLCRGIYRNPGDDRELAVYAGINLAEIALIRGATDEAENTLTQVLLDHPSTRSTQLAEYKLRVLRAIQAGQATAEAAADPAALIQPASP
ncbi:tetratricopeptide repeat protein [bacterium]|nr:tetratricopeptide repeat protein [bacterium]